jgi:hypothetical protein
MKAQGPYPLSLRSRVNADPGRVPQDGHAGQVSDVAIEVGAWKQLAFWSRFAARDAASSSMSAKPSITVRSTGATAVGGMHGAWRTPGIKRARRGASIIATRCGSIGHEGEG